MSKPISTQTIPNATTIDWQSFGLDLANRYLADIASHARQIDPDVFEIHGDWIKRQCRTEWLIARQACKAAIRTAIAEREDAKPRPIKPVWAVPLSSWVPRRSQHRPRHAVATNGEGDDHAR
jgi:hypothetical protein